MISQAKTFLKDKRILTTIKFTRNIPKDRTGHVVIQAVHTVMTAKNARKDVTLSHSFRSGPSSYNNAKPAVPHVHTHRVEADKKEIEPIVIENDPSPKDMPKGDRKFSDK